MRASRKIAGLVAFATTSLGLGAGVVITAPAAQALTCKVAAAGDVAGSDDYTTGANKTGAQIVAENPAKVLVPGDLAYDNGTASEFASYYNPGWGAFKAKTIPVPGNHEYGTSGAAGFVGYFGAGSAGNHATDVCGWRVVTVDQYKGGATAAISAGATFIRNERAAHPNQPMLVSWHEPRFSSGVEHGNNSAVQPLWQAAVDVKARLVINAHDHDYERFAPQNGSGAASASGPVEFVTGLGGHHMRGWGTVRANSAKRFTGTPSVLYLTLNDANDGYSFTEKSIDGVSRDSGTVAATTVVNKTPVAAFTSTASNLAASFDGSSSSDPDGTIASYAWTYGDGSTGTGATSTHTYGAAGTYQVALKVTDNGGATSTVTKSVTVSAPTAAQAAPTNVTAVVNANKTVTVSWTAAPGATSYNVWETTNTPTRPVGTVTTTSRTSGVLANGTYTYSVEAVGPNGTSVRVATTPSTTTVGATPPPPPPNQAPTANYTSTVNGLTVALDGTTSGDPDGTIAKYEWFANGGTTPFATTATASRTFTTAGVQTIDLRVTDNGGLTNTFTSQVTTTAPGGTGDRTIIRYWRDTPGSAFIGPVDGLTFKTGVDKIIPYVTTNTYSSADFVTTNLATGEVVDAVTKFDNTNWLTPTDNSAVWPSPAPGKYQIHVTATRLDGTTEDIGDAVVTWVDGNTAVNAAPLAQATVTQDVSTPGDYRAVVDGSASTDSDGTIAKYEWFVDGAVDAEPLTGATQEWTWGDAGPHTVRLVVTDDKGATGEVTKTITFPDNPALPTGPEQVWTIVQPDNKVTTEWDNVRGAVSYNVWEATKTPTRPVATVAAVDGTSIYSRTSSVGLAAGRYTYSVEAVFADGTVGPRTETDPQVTWVGAVPAATATFTADVSSGAAPLDVQFTNTSTNGEGYYWDFGDGQHSDEANPAHTFAQGTYGVTLTTYNQAGSVTSAQTVITAGPETPIMQAAPTGVTATVNPDKTVTVAWAAAAGATSYNVWEPSHTPDRPVGTVTGTSRTSGVLPNGTYTYLVEAVGPNGTSDRVAATPSTVTVGSTNPPPVVAPVASFTADKTGGDAPLTVAFDDTSSNNPTSWSWSFGDGTAVSTSQNPSHTFTKPGVYTITLTATNAGGSSTATKTLTVSAPPSTSNDYTKAKPSLVNPIIINVPDSGGSFRGFGGRDILVKADPTGDGIVNGTLTTYGGNNIVLEGGQYQGKVETDGSGRTRAMYIQSNTGSVWLEGLEIGARDGTTKEGINFLQGTGAAQVVTANVKCNPLSGTRDTNHSDCIQDWAGSPGQVVSFEHIDSVGVIYQGIMWQPQEHGQPPARWEMHHVRFDHAAGRGGYDIFNGNPSTPLFAEDVKLVDSAGSGYYPKATSTRPLPAGISLVSSASSVLLPGANGTVIGAKYQSTFPVKIQ